MELQLHRRIRRPKRLLHRLFFNELNHELITNKIELKLVSKKEYIKLYQDNNQEFLDLPRDFR